MFVRPFHARFQFLCFLHCQRRSKIPPFAGAKIHHLVRCGRLSIAVLRRAHHEADAAGRLWASRALIGFVVLEFFATMAALGKTVALAIHLKDMDVMGQSVE